jgi:hypothetical protein
MNVLLAHPGADRRDLLARVGAAVVGAGVLSVLRTHRASADCAPPGRCFGLPSCSCHGGGCPSSPSGGCCWTYTTQDPCQTFRCCDHACADGTTGICRYLVCNCCF